MVNFDQNGTVSMYAVFWDVGRENYMAAVNDYLLQLKGYT